MRSHVLERDGQRLLVVAAGIELEGEVDIQTDGPRLIVRPLKSTAAFLAEPAAFWAEIDRVLGESSFSLQVAEDEHVPPISFDR